MSTVPILSLRMQSNPSIPIVTVSNTDELVDRMKVLISQDVTGYRCNDYLARRATKETSSSQDDDCPPEEDCVDDICREKMCEWSYRVCDHFRVGREAVEFSFSYLDRFVDLCNCDRTAFKLAAMTTLYMATKVFSSGQITLRKLAELSRGEFEMSHIAEMEMIILRTLGWRVNPPTVKSFIDCLFAVLPDTGRPQVPAAVYKRALFFAELSLYDYHFTLKEKALVGLAALLNAIEGLDEVDSCQSREAQFLASVEATFGGLCYPKKTVDNVRHRLWYVYSMSAQFKEDEVISSQEVPGSPQKPPIQNQSSSQPSHSPVCVVGSY